MNGGSNREAPVTVYRDARPVPDHLPDLMDGRRILFEILSRDLHLKPQIPHLHLLGGNPSRLLWRVDDKRIVGRNTVRQRPAQQCRDRHSQPLAENIKECYVVPALA